MLKKQVGIEKENHLCTTGPFISWHSNKRRTEINFCGLWFLSRIIVAFITLWRTIYNSYLTATCLKLKPAEMALCRSVYIVPLCCNGFGSGTGFGITGKSCVKFWQDMEPTSCHLLNLLDRQWALAQIYAFVWCFLSDFQWKSCCCGMRCFVVLLPKFQAIW